MTQLELLAIQLGMANPAINGTDYKLLTAILDSAENAILAKRYPFGTLGTLEARYYDLQIRLAVVMYNKRGAEGEKSHNENGINRTYESVEELLKEVVPLTALPIEVEEET